MCYAYKPVYGLDGKLYKVPHREFQELTRDGRIIPASDGYHYAQDNVITILKESENYVLKVMRWDLVPRFYLQNQNITVSEMIKKKNSRAINPETGKSWGFSSYNARAETVQVLPSFKNLWINRQRCLIPVAAYKERPNMEDAPLEFRKKEYEVLLKEPRYFAGLYDDWVSKKTGEVLESCTLITVSSKGNSKIESIWHERMPVLLNEDESELWLNRELNANSVELLIKQDKSESLEILEVMREANPNLFE